MISSTKYKYHFKKSLDHGAAENRDLQQYLYGFFEFKGSELS